ncbi:MAG: hypothetical protein KJ624_06635 [Chloroflexi bacterium]|nr:hypothetical protein [Chloroflexota bacterium]
MVLPLKPAMGGFLRAVGCGKFIREFLMGHSPEGSPAIDPAVGAPQAEIFYHYKMALIKATALDRTTRREEQLARRENRAISPDNIERLTERYVARSPYKASGGRYHSFVVYFSTLRRLGWVEPTGEEEPSQPRDYHPNFEPRTYYRLTAEGMRAMVPIVFDPILLLYPDYTREKRHGPRRPYFRRR